MLEAAHDAAAVFGRRATVFDGRYRRDDDDVGEDVVRAYRLGSSAIVGVTATALTMAELPGALARLEATYGPRRDISLDDRRAAIVAAATLETATIDIKLAQLMATTLLVLDVLA